MPDEPVITLSREQMLALAMEYLYTKGETPVWLENGGQTIFRRASDGHAVSYLIDNATTETVDYVTVDWTEKGFEELNGAQPGTEQFAQVSTIVDAAMREATDQIKRIRQSRR